MRASPYDALAYRPATISALTSASIRRKRKLLRRNWHDRRACRLVLRPDEDRLAARQVLGHDVAVRRLAGLVELDRPAREDRLVPGRVGEGLPDRVLVDRTGLREGRIEDPGGLPAGRAIPLGRVLRVRLPHVDPRLDGVAGLLLIEPHG